MMHASEVTKNLPSTDEILRAIGLQRRSPANDVLSSVAVFGAGVLVGAGLALLFAPAAGSEVREQLGSRLEEVRDRVAHVGQGGQQGGKGASRAANGG